MDPASRPVRGPLRLRLVRAKRVFRGAPRQRHPPAQGRNGRRTSERSRSEPLRARLAVPTSIVVWGSNRALLVRVALARARAARAELFGFVVRDGDPSGPVDALPRLDPSRTFGVASEEVAPDARGDRSGGWSIVADLPTSADVASLRVFLLMLPRPRGLVTNQGPGRLPATFVGSNADRAAPCSSPDPRPFGAPIPMRNGLGLTLFLTTGRGRPPKIGDFSVSIGVSAAPGAPASSAACEADAPMLRPAFLPGARPLPPAVLDALAPALSPSSQGAP